MRQSVPATEQQLTSSYDNPSPNKACASGLPPQLSEKCSESASIVLDGSIQHPAASSIPVMPKSSGLINWLSIRIQSDPDVSSSGKNLEIDVQLDLTSRIYLESYFTTFHHQWPIIHRPTFDQGVDTSLVLLPVKMIGAWLVGTAESRQFAIDTHNTLMEQIIPQLVCYVGLIKGVKINELNFQSNSTK
jgi:hypothetical protein